MAARAPLRRLEVLRRWRDVVEPVARAALGRRVSVDQVAVAERPKPGVIVDEAEIGRVGEMLGRDRLEGAPRPSRRKAAEIGALVVDVLAAVDRARQRSRRD
jgi:hypothetical protein